MRTLYIFVTTDRPDQYLNSIVHCINKGTNRVILVQVEDGETEQVQLNLLRTNVYDLLQNLSSGYYKHYTGNLKDTLILLSTQYSADEVAKIKAQYKFCLTDNVEWEIARIKYLNLKKYISSLGKRDNNITLDITSVSKTYIGDIFACCLLENISDLYTFDLLVKPNYDEPWKTLIHELKEGTQYRYLNLVETPIFKESSKAILIRTTPLLISIIGTVLFIALALLATFILGSSSVLLQTISTIGTVLGTSHFCSYTFLFVRNN